MALSYTSKLALSCAALLALSSSTAAAAPRGAESFTGTCEMSGEIRNEPPLTTTSRPTSFRGRFTGVCTGELTGRRGRATRVNRTGAAYDGRGAGALSCLGGVSTGTGTLRFARGPVIAFRLTERRGPGFAVVTLDGTAGGSGVVVGTVSRDEDLAEINERCMSSGVGVLRGDARITAVGLSG
jgi:hypothetical protein